MDMVSGHGGECWGYPGWSQRSFLTIMIQWSAIEYGMLFRVVWCCLILPHVVLSRCSSLTFLHASPCSGMLLCLSADAAAYLVPKGWSKILSSTAEAAGTSHGMVLKQEGPAPPLAPYSIHQPAWLRALLPAVLQAVDNSKGDIFGITTSQRKWPLILLKFWFIPLNVVLCPF